MLLLATSKSSHSAYGLDGSCFQIPIPCNADVFNVTDRCGLLEVVADQQGGGRYPRLHDLTVFLPSSLSIVESASLGSTQWNNSFSRFYSLQIQNSPILLIKSTRILVADVEFTLWPLFIVVNLLWVESSRLCASPTNLYFQVQCIACLLDLTGKIRRHSNTCRLSLTNHIRSFS